MQNVEEMDLANFLLPWSLFLSCEYSPIHFPLDGENQNIAAAE